MQYPTSDGTSEEGELVAENQSATDQDVAFGTKGLQVYKFSSKVVTVPWELLQDSTADIAGFIEKRLQTRLGRVTNRNYTVGTGVGQPMGAFTAAAVGKIGAVSALPIITYDDLVDLEHSVDPAYRQLAKWMFHDDMLKLIRKVKDDQAQAPTTRLADDDWLSAPGDSPANARYEGLVAEGVNLVQELSFWPWGGDPVSQTAAAECVVADAEGLLDDLALSGASGAAVRILQVDDGGMLADAAPVFRCVIDQIEVNDDGSKTLHLRDAHDYLGQTINRGVFLPNITSLAWKPQPVVIGAVASVPAAGANSDATAMFLADSPVHVNAVMDRGDLMEDGTFSMAPDGQQLLLKSPPVTPVVVDGSSIGPGMAPARLEQAVGDVMARLSAGAWSAADCAAVDAATGYAGIGYYAGAAITGRDALNAMLPSYGVGCYQDPTGVLRFVQVVAPETYQGQPAFEISEADMASDLVGVPDDAPNLTRRMAYRPNAQALGASDLVTDVVDVPQSRRDELTGLYRGQVFAAGALDAHYRRADAADPVISLFWHAADAQAEINRVVAMYQRQRFFYQVAIRGDQDMAPLPGQIGRLTYSRYGLADGKPVLVRRVERNPATGDVVLTLWG